MLLGARWPVGDRWRQGLLQTPPGSSLPSPASTPGPLPVAREPSPPNRQIPQASVASIASTARHRSRQAGLSPGVLFPRESLHSSLPDPASQSLVVDLYLDPDGIVGPSPDPHARSDVPVTKAKPSQCPDLDVVGDDRQHGPVQSELLIGQRLKPPALAGLTQRALLSQLRPKVGVASIRSHVLNSASHRHPLGLRGWLVPARQLRQPQRL